MSQIDTASVAQVNSERLEEFAVDGIIPKKLARPATYEEAAQLLREANTAGQKVAIRGGGTKMGLGNPIQGLDLLISTSRLDRVLEYEAADLTLAVQAGANLAAVQAQLEKQGQFLPIEAPLSGQATIGGVVATNSTGPTRLQYGAARDWLIGVRFILADGTQAHAGGRVVKNVAGFDLMKIFVGSLGTLGLIVDLNFKLLPMPKASSTMAIQFENEQAASQAALKIIDRGLFPVSETILETRAAAALGLTARTTLLIEVRNTSRAVERQVREISQIGRENGATGSEQIAERDTQRQLWASVLDFAYRPGLNPQNTFSLKVGVLPNQSAAILKQASQIALQNEVELEGLAHVGHGSLYLTGRYADEDQALKTITELTATVENMGGWLVAERLPLTLKQRLADIWGNSLNEGEVKLMRAIKHQLDPANTLNPGRYIGHL